VFADKELAGHSQFYSAMVGSTAERLVRLAPCTIIVVK